MITIQNTMFMGKSFVRKYTAPVVVVYRGEDFGNLTSPADTTDDWGNLDTNTPTTDVDYGDTKPGVVYDPPAGDQDGFFGSGINATQQVTWSWTVSTGEHYRIQTTGYVDSNDPGTKDVSSPFFGNAMNWNMVDVDTLDAQQGTVHVTAVDADGNTSNWTLLINYQVIG